MLQHGGQKAKKKHNTTEEWHARMHKDGKLEAAMNQAAMDLAAGCTASAQPHAAAPTPAAPPYLGSALRCRVRGWETTRQEREEIRKPHRVRAPARCGGKSCRRQPLYASRAAWRDLQSQTQKTAVTAGCNIWQLQSGSAQANRIARPRKYWRHQHGCKTRLPNACRIVGQLLQGS